MIKTKIFFTYLVFCFVWLVNAQTEFAPKDAKWYYYCYQYTVEKDTVVNGKNCSVISYNQSSHLNEIMYEEYGKVYYLFNGVFRKVFDFNVETGDNVQLELKYTASPQNPIEVITYNCFVNKISYENVGNLLLKAVTVSFDVSFDEDGFPEQKPWTWTWSFTYYERIGLMTDHYFLPIIKPFSTAEDVPLLGYQDNILTYIDYFWVGFMGKYCDYPNKPTVTANEKNEQLNIYPNSFSDNVFVSANNAGSVEIIDVSGRIVHYSKLSIGTNEISTSHFAKGIYFVKIQNEDNSIRTFKIVKP